MNLFEFFQNGGMVMYPLLICSILLWAVAIEKWWFLHQFTKQFEVLYDQAKKLLEENKLNEARGLCHNTHPVIAAPYLSLFERDNCKTKEMWEERVSRRISEGQQGLRKYLWILATIGTSSPFIGLFGTVIGIIRSFQSIAASGKSGFSVVSAGLAEALIATAAGIIIAVVSVVFYNYFQNRVNNINIHFKNGLADLVDSIEKFHG